eukprot:7030969-Pyramimonas_sp.AAC.1
MPGQTTMVLVHLIIIDNWTKNWCAPEYRCSLTVFVNGAVPYKSCASGYTICVDVGIQYRYRGAVVTKITGFAFHRLHPSKERHPSVPSWYARSGSMQNKIPHSRSTVRSQESKQPCVLADYRLGVVADSGDGHSLDVAVAALQVEEEKVLHGRRLGGDYLQDLLRPATSAQTTDMAASADT